MLYTHYAWQWVNAVLAIRIRIQVYHRESANKQFIIIWQVQGHLWPGTAKQADGDHPCYKSRIKAKPPRNPQMS
eukprot:61667-Pelagomonas_calceolata.AAC.8